MRAKFVNEIKKGDGLSGLDVGRIGVLNIPKRLKEMAKTWDWNDFYDEETDVSMDARYEAKYRIHTLTFDWTYNIMASRDSIDNPYIIYDENNQTVEVFHGGVNLKNHDKEPAREKFDLNKDEDFDIVLDGIDNEWASEFYYTLISNVEDYGNANDEDDEDDRDYTPETGGLNY